MMLRTLILSLLLGVPLAAQHGFQLDTTTPEGMMLQQAGQEEDEAKKIALYESFLAKYPQHAGVPYAWAQLQPLFLKAGQYDKVIAGAEVVLAVEPADSVAAYRALEAVEKKKDYAAIKAWEARTVDAAKRMLATKQPADEAQVETWKNQIDFATQVQKRCEYALYAAALQSTDPKVIVDLGSTLDERHPQSEYLAQVAPRYLSALKQTGQADKAATFAEKVVAMDKTNEDVLMLAADAQLQGAKNLPKAIEYSAALVELMGKKSAPEGVDAATWDKKKKTLTGLGYWMQGMAFQQQQKWPETDKAMRAAAPYIAGNNDLLGPAYFFIGLANYNMAKANPKLRLEAKKYNELCAAINGPYQQQAAQNLKAISAGK